MSDDALVSMGGALSTVQFIRALTDREAVEQINQLLDRTGRAVSVRTWQHWKHAAHAPRPPHLRAVAEWLGVDVVALRQGRVQVSPTGEVAVHE